MLKSQQLLAQPKSTGIDVANWANDNLYFKSILKPYEFAQTKNDGSETGEKLINKEDAEKAVR